MNYLEIVGTLIGVLYLYWEYKASAWLWLASIAMPAIYLKVYYDAGLYADLGISIYYIIASIYGLICWMIARRSVSSAVNNDTISTDNEIGNIPRSKIIWGTVAFVIVFIIIGEILSRFTDSTVPWADAFTTALSIVAMWMLAKKYVEQWLVWIVADVALVVLYAYKDLWFTAALYLAYAIIAVLGYRKWKLMMYKNGND